MTDTDDTGTVTGSFEALQAAVGWTAEQRVDVVERRHLRDYRRAIGADEDGTDVPVTITACFLTEPPTMPEALAYGMGWINGGDRFEVHRPLQLGDEVTSQLTFTGAQEKVGRTGTLALLTFVTEFRLPDGTLAVRHVGTRVRR
ncbi:FAS1-like dehydratase domain-containing protein [Blastococcus haudaquaticus]|uniref:N-terminal half of MaoC dehydratase n=1 Tax=Blastococcus haudaquaticus TaxID=1938745 RepID=A0A286H7S6_9ACTN|nr:MaoC family dehydratase N-terminal domain-containing protein [Blastococcus haudaquaticus]SOE03843.1 N-terminal half of MaoC dehydratase [Blastococcus haudaquaticus]